MKKYMEIIKIYMKTQLIWRWDTFMDVLLAITKIVFVRVLWSILFEGKEQIAGMGFYTMISYYIISSHLYQLDKSSEISQQMAVMLRNGTFSKYMVIPVHIQNYFVAMVAGKALFSAFFGSFTMVLCFCFFNIPFVSVISAKLLFYEVIMIVLGLLFMAELNYFLGILTLKFEEISTFLMIKDNLSAFVTGAIVPLALLPDWMLSVMKCLPFYYVTYLPSMLLVGKQQEEAIVGIIILSVWCIVFAVLNQVTYEHYRIKYDGAGI